MSSCVIGHWNCGGMAAAALATPCAAVTWRGSLSRFAADADGEAGAVGAGSDASVAGAGFSSASDGGALASSDRLNLTTMPVGARRTSKQPRPRINVTSPVWPSKRAPLPVAVPPLRRLGSRTIATASPTPGPAVSRGDVAATAAVSRGCGCAGRSAAAPPCRAELDLSAVGRPGGDAPDVCPARYSYGRRCSGSGTISCRRCCAVRTRTRRSSSSI